MTSFKMGVAVIGTGILGSRHARVWHELPETRLIAVVDLLAERAQSVADKYGARWTTDLTTILNDPTIQAVSVATPDFLHHDTVIRCLEAGKDVLVEKPLATDLAEAQHMVDVARKTAKILQVNFSQRFVPEFAFIKETIAAGTIGKVQMIQSLKHDTIYVPTGMIPWSAKTSPVYFMTSHDLDLIRWYLEADPVSVFAVESRGKLDGMGIPVHDGLQGMVRFSNGTAVQFHTSWIHPNTFPSVSDGHLEIIGTDGIILYRSRTREVELYTNSNAQTTKFTGPATANEVQGKLVGGFVDSFRLFIQSVRDRSQPMTSAADSLPSVACQIAMLDSASRGGIQVEIG